MKQSTHLQLDKTAAVTTSMGCGNHTAIIQALQGQISVQLQGGKKQSITGYSSSTIFNVSVCLFWYWSAHSDKRIKQKFPKSSNTTHLLQWDYYFLIGCKEGHITSSPWALVGHCFKDSRQHFHSLSYITENNTQQTKTKIYDHLTITYEIYSLHLRSFTLK